MSTEKDNLRHFTDAQRGTYEVWYLTWNHAATGQGFWLRHIIEAPLAGPARGELWFARMDPKDPHKTFGIRTHLAVPVSSSAPFRLDLGAAQLGHDHAIGALAGNGHAIRWNLRWQPAARTLRYLPDVMYLRGGLGETTVQGPNPRVPLTGELEIDGEKLTFDNAVLGQSHVWGKKHAYSWAWAHCADFPGAPDAVMELIAVQLQRGGRTLPRMTLVALDLDGERYRLNQWRHVMVNRGRWGAGRVEFTAQSLRAKIEGELSAPPEAFVNCPYEDPDGTQLWCANTEIGDARLVVYERDGLAWRERRRLETRGRAHFELGSRERDPDIVREHVLV